MISILVSNLMIELGLCSLFFFFRGLFLKGNKDRSKNFFSLACLGSSLWSCGYGLMIIMQNDDIAYLCRVVNILGVLIFLVAVQYLVCTLTSYGRKKFWIAHGSAIFSIPLFFLVSRKEEIIVAHESWGTTYVFTNSPINWIYSIYNIFCAIFVFVLVVSMMSSKIKRIRRLGHYMFWVEMVVVFGMVLDMIFPLLGKGAIPGSTLFQFFGILALYITLKKNDKSIINVDNVTEYIYYSLDIPVVVLDHEKKIKIVNDSAGVFLGTGLIYDKRISDYFEMSEYDLFSFPEKSKDFDVICKSNQILCNLAVSKIIDPYGDVIGYILIITDLTERNNVLLKMEEAKQLAEEANKAKSLFLASMSHEIRTPMNAIVGFSELAMKSENIEDMKEYASDIRQASLSLLSIINDILDISKIESGKAQLVIAEYDTMKLLKSVCFMVQGLTEKKNLKFITEFDEQIPKILNGDKTRIREILINLLNNAVKYTQSGFVKFKVSSVMEENNCLLTFEISDSGIGIKETEIEGIFDLFSRADLIKNRSIEGTGLGLSITKGLIMMMNGEISVQSTYQKGSTFTVRISQPVIDATPIGKEILAGHSVDQDEFSLGNVKIKDASILVVDDNRINLKVFAKSLMHYGIEAQIANSGKEAIEICRTQEFDIVFMDQMMPEMDGVAAMNEIRKLSRHYEKGQKGKLVALTANSILGARQELLDAGFDDYLGKPVNYKELESIFFKMLKDKIEA